MLNTVRIKVDIDGLMKGEQLMLNKGGFNPWAIDDDKTVHVSEEKKRISICWL